MELGRVVVVVVDMGHVIVEVVDVGRIVVVVMCCCQRGTCRRRQCGIMWVVCRATLMPWVVH
jgi:hypothetical protein